MPACVLWLFRDVLHFLNFSTYSIFLLSRFVGCIVSLFFGFSLLLKSTIILFLLLSNSVGRLVSMFIFPVLNKVCMCQINCRHAAHQCCTGGCQSRGASTTLTLIAEEERVAAIKVDTISCSPTFRQIL